MKQVQPSDRGNSPYFQPTKGAQQEKTHLLKDSSVEVKREAYKVNWKIAVPLLIAGVLPGLIYLGGIALLNCLGGKKVTVEREVHRSTSTNPSYPSLVKTDRTAISRKGKEKTEASSAKQNGTPIGRSSGIPDQKKSTRKKNPLTIAQLQTKPSWSTDPKRKDKQIKAIFRAFEREYRPLSSEDKVKLQRIARSYPGPQDFLSKVLLNAYAIASHKEK